MWETDWGGNWVCSDGQGHDQYIFNLIFYWWVELWSLPIIYLGPNYGGSSEDNGNLLQKFPNTQCPQSCSRPPLTHASAVDSWTYTSKSRSVSCWLINKRLLLSMSSERSIVSCYSPVLSRWQWWLVFSKSIIRGNLESLSVFLFLCIGRVNGDLCRMKFSISALQCISPRWNLAP